jgi:SAM-dependent methyltransferase
MTDRQAHWDGTYSAKGDAVSWHQPGPGRSLAMIGAAAARVAESLATTSVIDIGAGASRLAGDLIAAGCADLTVLDISPVALARSRERLHGTAGKLAWIVADITAWTPARSWDIWHDRAVFHFLTDAAAQDAYIAALKQATRPGAAVILSTFAPTGPETCSGLPVERYSAESLARRLGPDFALYAQENERHQTPFGTAQDFIYAGFRRR